MVARGHKSGAHPTGLTDYGQSPWPGLNPRVTSQLVPVFVHVILASPAANAGVSTIVSATPAVVVAPVVAVITPFVTVGTAVMFFVTSMVGIPLVPALHPVRVPVSAWQSAIAVLVEAISDAAPAALVRDV